MSAGDFSFTFSTRRDPRKPPPPATRMRLLTELMGFGNMWKGRPGRFGFQIGVYHHAHKILKVYFGPPAKLLTGFAGITHKLIDFGRPVIAWIDLHMLF